MCFFFFKCQGADGNLQRVVVGNVKCVIEKAASVPSNLIQHGSKKRRMQSMSEA